MWIFSLYFPSKLDPRHICKCTWHTWVAQWQITSLVPSNRPNLVGAFTWEWKHNAVQKCSFLPEYYAMSNSIKSFIPKCQEAKRGSNLSGTLLRSVWVHALHVQVCSPPNICMWQKTCYLHHLLKCKCLADSITNRLNEQLTEWMTEWLNEWLMDWLTHSLTVRPTVVCNSGVNSRCSH
jgi:hypothetical protein